MLVGIVTYIPLRHAAARNWSYFFVGRKSRQRAQSDTSLRTNPLVGPNPAQGRLWASGLREPFGLSSPLGAQAHPPKIARFWCGVARTALNDRFMARPLFVDLSGVRPDPLQNRAGDLPCAPSVAVVSGLEMAVLSPCGRGLGMCSLLVVCTRNWPPHQSLRDSFSSRRSQCVSWLSFRVLTCYGESRCNSLASP